MKKRNTSDTLALLRKAGRIDGPTYEAARRFQGDFSVAGLEGVKGIDYEKVGGSGSPGNPTERAVMAAGRVESVMGRLGGMGTISGRVVWDIVGLGRNMSEWAAANRYDAKEAKGILLGALDQLARAYGYA